MSRPSQVTPRIIGAVLLAFAAFILILGLNSGETFWLAAATLLFCGAIALILIKPWSRRVLLLTALSAAVIGFGVGSLLTPLLTLRLSPALAVAVVALPHLLATATRLFRHAPSVDRSTFLRFGLLSASGGLAGALLQSTLSAPALLGALGVLLIATALASLTGNFGGPARR